MKLDTDLVRWAVNSLGRHGDTDLFPKPIEIDVLQSDLDRSVSKISDIDISIHQPSAPRRFIVPKDDLSYRAATQLEPLDSVILTAIIRQFGQGLEDRRRPVGEQTVFSYRFSPSSAGDLYQSREAWNQYWNACFIKSASAKAILNVDIADYYNQIYHHVIENQLNESSFPNQVTKWILRMLEMVSAKVSRGIPVGPHPAHLLAEASLIPIDNSLSARGLHFCRFVDDIVVFATDMGAARTYLYQLAEILDKQQQFPITVGRH
jgi:retron-type reverse transcriptase